MIHINPIIVINKATIFHNKLPAGRTIGENAIPTAPKNATTQLVQPNVRIPNINVKNGMALLPTG